MQYKIERIGIHILAFLVARCQLLGMYPFIVPFFMGAYLQERSSIGMFAVLMLGLASRLDGVEMIKYGMVLVFLLLMIGKTDRKKLFTNDLQIGLAAGVVLWSVSLPYQYIVTGNDSSLIYTVLEGIMATCFTLVFSQGFEAFRVGTKRMFAKNERFVGVFAILLVAMFGCPTLTKPFNLLYAFCCYILLFNVYRFEAAVGVATGSIAGLAMSIQFQNVSYLAVMIILSSIVVVMRELGKVGIALSFLAAHILLGFLYESDFLNLEMLCSALIVVSSFIVTPVSWMKRVQSVKEEVVNKSSDLFLQEVTGQRIQKFGQAFIAMEKMLELHEENRTTQIPNGLSNIYLSGDGISLLNAVESQSNRLEEMRWNFIKQLGRIGDIITGFEMEVSREGAMGDLFESRLTEMLSRQGIIVTKAMIAKGKNEHSEVFVSCYREKECVVTGKQIGKKVEKLTGKRFICINRGDDMVSEKETCFSFAEEGKFMLTTGVVRRNRVGEELCGDNFSVTKLDAQKALLMISDGMGSGKTAYVKSEQIVELLEQLLAAGFCRELAIELLNSFVSFLADGDVSSSLDLTMIDFYTGIADFIKLGASTTFIKRKGRVECIRSTSLPMGVLEQVEFDTCARKLYDGDMIIMVSDGVLDGIIFENKETYLADLICDIHTNNAQSMAQAIMEDIEKMQKDGLKDDSTVLTAGVWER